MRTFKLNKLVRDEIPAKMQEQGQHPEIRTVSGDELLMALKEKLIEEVTEFDPTDLKALEELTDLQEVIDELVVMLGSDSDKFWQLQKEKREKVGGFAGHVFVDTLTLDDNNEWAAYYLENPERFPEVIDE